MLGVFAYPVGVPYRVDENIKEFNVYNSAMIKII